MSEHLAATVSPGTPTVAVGGVPGAIAATSQTWSVLAHRSVGDLVITTTPAGVVTGTIFGDAINGFWHEASQRLIFARVINGEAFEQSQVFRGFMFTATLDGSVVTFLSGAFFAGPKAAGGSVDQHEFGWVAALRGTSQGALVPGDPAHHLLDVFGAVPQGEPLSPSPVPGAFSWDSGAVLNGHVVQIAIRGGVAGQGWADARTFVEGAIGGSPRLTGFLHLAASGGDLTFLRQPSGPLPVTGDDLQLFYAHPVELTADIESGATVMRGFTGHFSALAGTGAKPGRTEFGWFATETPRELPK